MTCRSIFGWHRISFLAVVALLAMGTPLFAQMPPHPELLKKIRSGEIREPYVLQHIDLLRKQGMDSPWSSPVLEQSAPLRKPAADRPFGPAATPTGTWRALVILLQFPDKPSQVSVTSFDTLLFGDRPGTLRDYFTSVSYGSLDIVTANPPGTTGWVTAPNTYAYYANGQNGQGAYPQNAKRMVEDAVAAVDSLVDFSLYDNDHDGYVDALFVIHTGPGAEFTGSNDDIWSHASTTSKPLLCDGVRVYRYSTEPEYWQVPGDMTIGVYAHELGHAAFNLPDLYDTDYSSKGLGVWSVMAYGCWNGRTGNSPAFPDAYSHIMMGYVVPVTVSANTPGQVIRNVEASPEVYRVWSGGSAGEEYFLAENRQRTGYDTGLPTGGLLIYHVDQAVTTENRAEWYPGHTTAGHYQVALEQADGQWHLEKGLNQGDGGDVFPGSSSNRTFDLATTPNTGDYVLNLTGVAFRNISDSGPSMSVDIAVFPPSITLTAPNGGERWQAGTSCNITWSSSQVTSLKIDCSTDNGAHWTLLTANTPAETGFYPWNVPVTPSSMCLVRLSDVSSPSLADSSEQGFGITLGAVAETEPNNTRTEANILIYGDSLDATIGTTADVDYFAFTAAVHDTVVIRAADRDSSTLQGEIRLLDESGTLLASNSNYGAPSRAKLVYGVHTAGVYYIRYAYTGDVGSFPGSPLPVVRPAARFQAAAGTTPAAATTGDYRLSLVRFRASPPELLRGSAASVFWDHAAIVALVDPNGSPTTVTFEYGPTAAYGSNVQGDENPLSGFSPVIVGTSQVQGLEVGTANHFRIVATNSSGTTAGPDVLLTTPQAPEGWGAVSSGTTSVLTDISFPDASNGTAVGASGTILRTTNSGISWLTQTSGTGATLNGVSFADAQRGVAVGDGGLILHTSNGGQTWSASGELTLNTLHDVTFADFSDATAVGSGGTIARTTDGGATWALQTSGTSNALYGVFFRSSHQGFAVGEAGTLLSTTDGGSTWTKLSSPVNAVLRTVAIADSLNALAGGENGLVLRTTDGGATWQEKSTPTTNTVRAICYTGERSGLAVGDAGTILTTADGGESWTPLRSGTFNTLTGIITSPSGNGVAVGQYGTILLTETPLVVELASFDVSLTKVGEVHLTWVTSSETKNYGFQVQRRFASDQPFTDIPGGFLPGYGTSPLQHTYRFVDACKQGVPTSYRLKQMDLDGSVWYSESIELNGTTDIQQPELPSRYELSQNYPNPFNPNTIIPFALMRESRVRLEVFNIIGERVALLVDEVRPPGFYRERFDASHFASGVYVYRIRANDFVKSLKLLILR